MAQQYLVLDQGVRAVGGSRYRFLRDGFAFWALLFPLPWLVIKGLWLEAIFLVAAYGALGAMALGESVMWLAALYTFNTVAALWVALDGRHWTIEKHLARGASLRAIVSADSVEEAELRFGLTAVAPSVNAVAQTSFVPVVKPKRASTNDVLFATPWGNS